MLKCWCSVRCVSRVGEQGDDLVDREGVFYAEYAASATLQTVQVGSCAERFSEVTGEGSDIGAFAAYHAYRCARQAEGRVVRHVYSARCRMNCFAHPTTSLRLWSSRFRAAGGTVLESLIPALKTEQFQSADGYSGYADQFFCCVIQ